MSSSPQSTSLASKKRKFGTESPGESSVDRAQAPVEGQGQGPSAAPAPAPTIAEDVPRQATGSPPKRQRVREPPVVEQDPPGFLTSFTNAVRVPLPRVVYRLVDFVFPWFRPVPQQVPTNQPRARDVLVGNSLIKSTKKVDRKFHSSLSQHSSNNNPSARPSGQLQGHEPDPVPDWTGLNLTVDELIHCERDKYKVPDYVLVYQNAIDKQEGLIPDPRVEAIWPPGTIPAAQNPAPVAEYPTPLARDLAFTKRLDLRPIEVIKSRFNPRWPVGRPSSRAIQAQIKLRAELLMSQRSALYPESHNKPKLSQIEQKRLARNARVAALVQKAPQMRKYQPYENRRAFIDRRLELERNRSHELHADERQILGHEIFDEIKASYRAEDHEHIERAWKPKDATTGWAHFSLHQHEMNIPDVLRRLYVPEDYTISSHLNVNSATHITTEPDSNAADPMPTTEELSNLEDATDAAPVDVPTKTSGPRGILKKPVQTQFTDASSQEASSQKSVMWRHSVFREGVFEHRKTFHKHYALPRDPKTEKADGRHLPSRLRYPREPEHADDSSFIEPIDANLQSSPHSASLLRDRSPEQPPIDDSAVEEARASFSRWKLSKRPVNGNTPVLANTSTPQDVDSTESHQNLTSSPAVNVLAQNSPAVNVLAQASINLRTPLSPTSTSNQDAQILSDPTAQSASNAFEPPSTPFVPSDLATNEEVAELPSEPITPQDVDVLEPPASLRRSLANIDHASTAADPPTRQDIDALQPSETFRRFIASSKASDEAVHTMIAEHCEECSVNDVRNYVKYNAFLVPGPIQEEMITTRKAELIRYALERLPIARQHAEADLGSSLSSTESQEQLTSTIAVKAVTFALERYKHLHNEEVHFSESTMFEDSGLFDESMMFSQSQIDDEDTALGNSSFLGDSTIMPASYLDDITNSASEFIDQTFNQSQFDANSSYNYNYNSSVNVDEANASSLDNMTRFRQSLPGPAKDSDDDINQVTLISSDSEESEGGSDSESDVESQVEDESEEESVLLSDDSEGTESESGSGDDSVLVSAEQVIVDLPPSLTAVVDLAAAKGVRTVSTHTQNLNDAALDRILASGGASAWLNDESIDDFLELICKRANEKLGYVSSDRAVTNVPPHVAFSSKWWSNMTAKGYVGVSRWSRRLRISEKRLLKAHKVFFPINVGGSHWTLMVIDMGKKTLEFLDSLGGAGADVLRAGREWLQGELGVDYDAADWADVSLRSGQQANMSDCGVFTCMNALAVARGVIPQQLVVAGRMRAARQQLAATLLVGSFAGVLEW